MQIKWLRKALKNLDDEAEYIAKDDPQAARLVVQRIVQTVLLLTENPSLGHPGRLPGTHELVIPNTRYALFPIGFAPACNALRSCVCSIPLVNNPNGGNFSIRRPGDISWGI